MKCAYSTSFLKDTDEQFYFLNYALLLPWAFGTIILTGFNSPFENWYWPGVLLGLGFPAFQVIDFDRRFKALKIKRHDSIVFPNKWLPAFLLLLIISCWIISFITISI